MKIRRDLKGKKTNIKVYEEGMLMGKIRIESEK